MIERIGKIVRCRESAKDIVQESYLVLMQRLAGQSITNPRAYLDRTATHLAFDHLKHRKVVASHRQETTAFSETYAPSAEQRASAEERIGRFDEALGELPQPYRDVFILLRLRGMSYLEAADALNLSERQVERYLLQALIHCRQALEKNRPRGNRPAQSSISYRRRRALRMPQHLPPCEARSRLQYRR